MVEPDRGTAETPGSSRCHGNVGPIVQSDAEFRRNYGRDGANQCRDHEDDEHEESTTRSHRSRRTFLTAIARSGRERAGELVGHHVPVGSGIKLALSSGRRRRLSPDAGLEASPQGVASSGVLAVLRRRRPVRPPWESIYRVSWQAKVEQDPIYVQHSA